jgi:hypothetical protein
MTLDAFRALVEANTSWFSGFHPEPASALDAAERALGIRLPPSLRWLLESRDYSAACGIDSLDEAVASTLRCRSVLGLPAQFVVLNDLEDAGLVVLDAATGTDPENWPVYWIGAHNLHRLAAGESVDRDSERYDGFGEWAQARLALAVEGA